MACVLAMALVIAAPRPGYSQILYGSLTGNVTDPTSAAVPGVHVEATNLGTNVKTEGDTDDRGVYRFTNLQPGTYRVAVTAKGFRPYVETNVEVRPNDVRRVDLKLQMAQTTETVEISADAVVLADR